MSFDGLARHYRWMEFVLAGNKLQRCRTAYLGRVSGARSILLAGEGNGRFLLACRRSLPSARITVLDSSARMLDSARRRLLRSGARCDGVEFVHSDILAWTPRERSCDLIVTHFFLDCFPAEQLEAVVSILARAAAPAATWLLADFQLPAHGLKRQRAKVIHALMYAFFRAASRLPARGLCPADGFLARHGFVREETRAHEWELLHTDLWARRPGVPAEKHDPELSVDANVSAFRGGPRVHPAPVPALTRGRSG